VDNMITLQLNNFSLSSYSYIAKTYRLWWTLLSWKQRRLPCHKTSFGTARKGPS